MTITVLALLLAAAQSGGATVKGRVVDSVTGAPLNQVFVAVESRGPSARTDDDGVFVLTNVAPGRHVLFVSVVGYALVRRDIDVTPAGLELTVPLSEGTGAYAEAVTVSADRFSAEPAVPAQQFLGSADLQNLRGVLADDPLRAVQVLPGVAAGDDLRSEFTVRGSGFAHVNMIVDGFHAPHILHTVRAVEDYSGSGSVAMINSDILQDVVLLAGSYPQRHGNRTGPEIQFRMREGSRARTHARLAVSGTNASAVGEGPIGRARRGSWLLSARQSYLDLITRHIEDGSFRFGFSDLQSKAVYDLSDRQRIDLTVLAGRSRAVDRDLEVSEDERFTARNGSVLVMPGWQRTGTRTRITARALAAVNEFSTTAVNGLRPDEGWDRQGAVRSDVVFAARPSISLEAGAQAEWTSQHRFRQREFADVYRTINDFTGDALRSGGYVQARLARASWTLVPGARIDRWSLTRDTTGSPWLQAQLRLARGISLQAAAGRHHQFPEFEQVIGAFASPTTRPLRADHFDIGLEQRLGATMRWQVTLYDREERNFFRRPLAETRVVGNVVVRGQRGAPFEQSLEGFARGVELLFQRKSAAGLSGWIAYAYGRHRYSDTARGETFDSDNDQRHTFNVYGFFRKSDRVSFSARMRFGSNVPAPGYYAESGGELFLSTRRNELRLPVYSRVDLRANRTYNWSRSRMTLFAEVLNVLNRDNVRFVPPRVNGTTGRVSPLYEQIVPIFPSIGVLFEF